MIADSRSLPLLFPAAVLNDEHLINLDDASIFDSALTGFQADEWKFRVGHVIKATQRKADALG